jgi:hypothetical protein
MIQQYNLRIVFFSWLFSRNLCSAAQEVSSDKLEVLLGPVPTSGKSYIQ